MELILNADPGVNYQWKTAAQAQGAQAALPAPWCFQTVGKEGGKGPGVKGCPDEILRSSCNTISHLLEAPSTSRTHPGGSLDAKYSLQTVCEGIA